MILLRYLAPIFYFNWCSVLSNIVLSIGTKPICFLELGLGVCWYSSHIVYSLLLWLRRLHCHCRRGQFVPTIIQSFYNWGSKAHSKLPSLGHFSIVFLESLFQTSLSIFALENLLAAATVDRVFQIRNMDLSVITTQLLLLWIS